MLSADGVVRSKKPTKITDGMKSSAGSSNPPLSSKSYILAPGVASEAIRIQKQFLKFMQKVMNET